MYCYRVIEITNLEPLKIGARGAQSTYTEPTAEHIPGSTLRGAIIGQLIRLGLFNDSTKSDFLLGMECYNAYPYFEKAFYLPTPFHLRIDKHKWREAKATGKDKVRLFNLLEEKENESVGKNQLESPFVTVEQDENALRGKKVAKEYRLHHSTSKNQPQTQRNNLKQMDSAKKERENLFRYQAISPEQSFRGVLKYKVELEQSIKLLLENERILYLGGSKGSGYGRSKVKTIAGPLQNYVEVKRQLGIKPFYENNRDKIIITCLSDCLFRNDFGQPINHLPEQYLYELTGKKAKLEKQFIQTGQTEGYNNTWQARYPKETTVKAGSVLKYSFSEKLTQDEMQSLVDSLERRQVGSRTQDGYGWLGVNLDYPEYLLINERKAAVDEKIDDKRSSDLNELLREDSIKNTFQILIEGLQDAKKRWLNMLFSQLVGYSRDNVDKELIISLELNSSQLKNMEDLIYSWIKLNLKGKKILGKSEGKEKTILERYYVNNHQLFSLNGCDLKAIWSYLNGGSNERLRDFADEKLKSQRGRMFYFDFHREQAARQLIADLVQTGLYIERMRRGRNEESKQ